MIKQQSPQIHEYIDKFYQTALLDEKFKITCKLTDLILEPVNGPWRDDEIIFFPRIRDSEILQTEKKKLLHLLFEEE